MRCKPRGFWGVASALAGAVLLGGCQQDPSRIRVTCPDAGPDASCFPPSQEITLTELPCQGLVGQAWQSTAWDGTLPSCEWLFYPSRTILQIEHDLGRVPAKVLIYLAFTSSGRGGALSAGDTTQLDSRRITDTSIVVLNGTNQDFYARVVVE